MSVYSEPAIFWYCCILSVVCGAVLGSFLNCAAYRIARRENFLTGRSRCPHCGHILTAAELIPLVSWAVQGGRCRKCRASISIRYPLTELFFAVMTLLCLLRFDLTLLFARNLVFGCCLFCLSLVDMEIMEIPDGALLLSAASWAAYLPFSGMTIGQIAGHILCGLAVGGGLLGVSLLFDRLLGKESMGGGDIKLFAVVGLYLGWAAALFAVLFSCVFGLLFAAVRKIIQQNGEERFPFAPFVSAAAWLMLLYGEPLVKWYLGLLC